MIVEGEHGAELEAAGWTSVEWFAKGHLTGGMGNTRKGGTSHQQHRERLWLSPHCLHAEQRAAFAPVIAREADYAGTLFDS